MINDKHFVELHNHTDVGSNVRMRDSSLTCEELITITESWGNKAVAITDHESICGHIGAINTLNELKSRDKISKDFKLILGNEIYLNDRLETEREKNDKTKKCIFNHFILLAKDSKGYEQIRKLSTIAWRDNYFVYKGMKRVPTYYDDVENIIGEDKGHIVALTACFPKGTKVYTQRGIIDIEKVQANDVVMTHTGEYKKVINPTQRNYSGELYTIRTEGGSFDITSTDNHKYFTINNSKDYTKLGYDKEYYEYLMKKSTYNKKNIDGVKQRLRKITTLKNPQWKEAKDLTENDILLCPIDSTIEDIKELNLKEFNKKIYANGEIKYKLPQKLEVTNDLLEVLGLYLADGSINRSRVVFTLNNYSKKELSKKVYNYFKNIGLNPSIMEMPESKIIEITISSVALYRWFESLFGKGAEDKDVPSFIKKLPFEKQLYFLKGYIKGDGYYRERIISNGVGHNITTVSVSRKMTKSLIEIWNRGWINPNLITSEEYISKDGVHHKESYYLDINGKTAMALKKFIYDEEPFVLYSNERKEKDLPYKYNNQYYMKLKIKKINKNKFNGMVYCLNVEDNHSFVAEGVIVHNCIGSRLGELFKQTIKEGKTEDEIEDLKDIMAEHIEWCIDMFGQDDFYIEMQPNQFEEQIEYNKMLVKIANAYDLQMVITTDSHYALEEEFKLHEAFLRSKEGDEERNVADFYKDSHLFHTKEIYENMNYLDEEIIDHAILNTEEIANKCIVGERNDYGMFKGSEIPLSPLPPKEEWYKLDMNVINKYEFMKNMFEDKYEYHTYLLSLIFKGLSYRKLAKNSTLEEYYERINEELQEVYLLSQTMNQPIGAYFTSEKANLDVMWSVSLIGVGRGSSVCFVINYLLEITDVDPILIRKMGIDMPVWRFMYRSKIELPDIDTDNCSHLKNQVFYKLREYYRSFESDVLRIITFKKETTKSAIKTACRGLNINSDVAGLLSSLVPIERGKVWDFEDCYYGNEKKHRKPIPEIVKLVDEYENVHLKDTILKINGLITGIGSHASGIIPINKDISYYSSIMRTPSNEIISSYDLHQIEKTGCVKYDALLTSAMSLIQVCMEKMCEDGIIEWQGDLKKTYQKYLSPSVIDLEDEEVWNNIANNKVMSLFQFYDSTVGREAINKIKPRKLIELANANALMRLMVEGEGQEQPLDKYLRFKEHPEQWEQEMIEYGLSENDRKICHELLDGDCGVCSSQESLMKLFMHPKTGNMGVTEVNILKKGVGKKIPELIEKFSNMVWEQQKNLGLSEKLIEYLLNVQTSYQKGYAFCLPHCIAYSLIAYIEAWLYTKYPKIYWYYANLTIQSNTIENVDEDIELDFETAKKTIDYGKIAKAIDDIMRQGVKITTPDINESDDSFKPVQRENTILYGLEGINSVNEEMVELIKENRPYISFMDFYNRVAIQKKETVNEETGKVTKKSIISNKAIEMLIKAGCFDKIEKDKTRDEILLQFCSILAKTKNKLTTTDITFMEDNNIIPLNLQDELRIYNFSNYLKKEMPTYKHETSKNMKWVKIKEDNEEDTEYDKEFFYEFFAENMEEGKDYFIDNEGIINVLLGTKRKGSFEDILSQKLIKLTDYMKTKEALNEVNTIKINEFKKPLFEGGINRWEMQSISFYSNEHELEKANCEKYDIVNFFDLPEESQVEKYGHFTIRKGEEAGKEVTYPIWKLNLIAGTILSKNNTKHIVTILTKEGVVNIKFQEGQYAFYNKKLSKEVWNDKKNCNEKKTVEDSWFKRGNILIICGRRNSDTFLPKTYANTRWKHTVRLVTDIKDNGDIVCKTERVKL